MTKKHSNSSADEVGLDDIMIAMDVVDTVRHNEELVNRELNAKDRQEDLIRRLKALYAGQGIDVPEHVLMEGVQALEDGRFVYTPPKDSFQVKLAKLYVKRNEWGVKMAAGIIVAVALWFGWQTWFNQPPKFDALVAEITAESRNPDVTAKAKALGAQGLLDHNAGRSKEKQAAENDLKVMLDTLRSAYTIKIVTDRGEKSGVWRVPKVNTKARNYYLIVRAVDGNGRTVKRSIKSEESGKLKSVRKWGVRVPKDVYDAVAADKKDDGIVQNDVVGVKERGYLKPQMKMQVLGGTITRW